MSAGRVFIQLPSVCGMCFPLVLTGWILWLICLKTLKGAVAAAAQRGGISDLHVVQMRWEHRASFICGVVISTPQILLLIAFHSLAKRAQKHEDMQWHLPGVAVWPLVGSSCPLESPSMVLAVMPSVALLVCCSLGTRSIAHSSYSFMHYTEWKQKSDINTESINHY